MLNKVMFALRLVVALLFVLGCRLFDIPVGPSGSKTLAQAVKVVRAARRTGAEGRVDLRQARAWHVVSKVSSLNGLFNDIYADTMFVARDSNLMAALVTGYSARGYATRTVPIYPSLAATSVAEGVDYTNAVEWTKTDAVDFVPGEIMSQVVLTDRRIQTDPSDARRDASIEMGGAIATKIDEDLVGLFSDFATDKGTAGSALTITRCAAALAKLRVDKVRAPFSFVLHPYGWHDIWTELAQPAVNQAFLGDTANQAMRDYFTGNFLAAMWFTSANISIDGSDDAVSGVFNREALALDTREAPTLEPERDASKRAWELNLHAGYATGVRRDDYGVALTHDATEPS